MRSFPRPSMPARIAPPGFATATRAKNTRESPTSVPLGLTIITSPRKTWVGKLLSLTEACDPARTKAASASSIATSTMARDVSTTSANVSPCCNRLPTMFSTCGVATSALDRRTQSHFVQQLLIPRDLGLPEVGLNPLHASLAAITGCQRTVHLQQRGSVLGFSLSQGCPSFPIREFGHNLVASDVVAFANVHLTDHPFNFGLYLCGVHRSYDRVSVHSQGPGESHQEDQDRGGRHHHEGTTAFFHGHKLPFPLEYRLRARK